MVKYSMYAIYNEDDDFWFNFEMDGWVDQFELEGDCLLPTEDMAQNFIEENLEGESVKVYKVELVATGSYEYSPVQ
ncbi:hypothetical protein AF332_11790 [Sporosarcina globispora]|uniref:Uncharacterized protein n=1 Tax=Sporosarcina globispora TaxID=1459 RepID=A0A0M0GDF4_SPOGL|nr:hypothetical protein [Sporosarcina globispora]KON87441.1 hypothetical protein AF332_11790 [Sporosarcina globispora]